MRLKWLAVVLATASAAKAQTVTPTIAELNAPKAKGEFTVRNDGVTPIAVIVEKRSFTVQKDLSIKTDPLPDTIKIKLSSTSALVGAQQTYAFDYAITCETYPCAVMLFAASSIGHTTDGALVRTFLPHVVYVCEKHQKNCRNYIREQVWGLPKGK
jgi:hypothetical protein